MQSEESDLRKNTQAYIVYSCMVIGGADYIVYLDLVKIRNLLSQVKLHRFYKV